VTLSRKVIDYDVITAPSIPELREKVHAALRKGWEPDRGFSVFPSAAMQIGGFINASAIVVTFAQAVIKYEGIQP
jgi:hypothetical protein